MFDTRIDLENAITRLLSRANRPLKARAIAAILGSEAQTSIHKREINPTLYRMLSKGKLSRDSQFRWFVNRRDETATLLSNEHASSLAAAHIDTPTVPAHSAPLIEPFLLSNLSKKESNDGQPYGSAAELEQSLKTVRPAPTPVRNYGRFEIAEEIRPYLRHCTWCSKEIIKGDSALVVRGVTSRCPRFCSEDCFHSWESIYWQRVALGHLGLSKEELKVEERYLRRQKYFRRFR